MSFLLPHLHTGWDVDKAIVNEEKRVVVIRFGRDDDPTCMQMDEAISRVSEDVKNFAVIYLVDIGEVPDFNEMYEIYDPCTVMFFFRNKHVMIDLGTGNNNKITWPIRDKQECVCGKAPLPPPRPATCLTRALPFPPPTLPLSPTHRRLIDIIEVVYRGARKGRGLVIAPKDYSTQYKY